MLRWLRSARALLSRKHQWQTLTVPAPHQSDNCHREFARTTPVLIWNRSFFTRRICEILTARDCSPCRSIIVLSELPLAGRLIEVNCGINEFAFQASRGSSIRELISSSSTSIASMVSSSRSSAASWSFRDGSVNAAKPTVPPVPFRR